MDPIPDSLNGTNLLEKSYFLGPADPGIRAEYWKSLPRKFCDICKCWFADNKASIDFHERGKRHQENAQKRIQDIQKRGIKEFKKQKELENEMEKIEKAALAAYKKDLQALQQGDKPQVEPEICKKQPKRTSESDIKDKSFNVPKKQKVVKSEEVHSEAAKDTSSDPNAVESIWYEAITDEGYKYYWNTESSESRWEPPEEGFISLEEQNLSNQNTEEELKSPEENNTSVTEEKSNKEDIPYSIGPQPKVDPYGQWVAIEKKKPVEYDLQLPKVSENIVEVVIPLHKEEPSLKFKEKVIGQLSDSDPGEVTFKKRKICSASRNARQRNRDDD